MKRLLKAIVAFCIVGTMLLAGCGAAGTDDSNTEKIVSDTSVDNVTSETSIKNASSENEDVIQTEEEADYSSVTVRVGGLKGPTSIGLLALKDDWANGKSALNYEFTMATAADEITTALVKGELDIALIPANVASVLYNKTEGKVKVIDINTLGVLYMVSGDNAIRSIEELEDKTVYLTGKGTTPDYVLQYVLKAHDMLEKVKLEYKSEASEVAAILADNPGAIGLLPQPFVTVACSKNEALSVIMNMQEQWDETTRDSGSRLVTGVTVVRKDFLDENEAYVTKFIEEHEISALEAKENVERVAKLAVESEIIGAEGVAIKAIPNCNITCISGDEMQPALEGYLTVLFNENPASVGGALPNEDFYFIKK